MKTITHFWGGPGDFLEDITMNSGMQKFEDSAKPFIYYKQVKISQLISDCVIIFDYFRAIVTKLGIITGYMLMIARKCCLIRCCKVNKRAV